MMAEKRFPLKSIAANPFKCGKIYRLIFLVDLHMVVVGSKREGTLQGTQNQI